MVLREEQQSCSPVSIKMQLCLSTSAQKNLVACNAQSTYEAMTLLGLGPGGSTAVQRQPIGAEHRVALDGKAHTLAAP